MLTRIEIDMTNWWKGMPSGAVAYRFDEAVDSEYCDSYEDFEEFLDRYADEIRTGSVDLVFRIEAGSFDACDTSRIRDHFDRIRSGREES